MVTAIVLNWNGLDATRRCLASLATQQPAPPAVRVVDNGSTDGSAEALAAELPPEVFLGLEANHGFAGGLNHALPHVTTPYVLLLNNDAALAPDTLARLVAALEADPGAAAATPTIYHGDPPARDARWYAGSHLGRWTAVVHHGATPPDGRTHAVSYASACCLLIRTADLAAMPEGYFMYFEDVELCDRLAAAGRRILWVSGAQAWHAGGASTGSQRAKAPALDYYDVRNGLEFIRRRRHGPARLTAWAYLACVRLPRKLARIAWSAPDRQASLGAVWRGLADGLAGRLGPEDQGV
jgi:GT2 family glycosyltransferase